MNVKITETGRIIMSDEQTITVTYDQSALQSERDQLQANIDSWTARIADIDTKLDAMNTEVQAGRVMDLRPAPVAIAPVNEEPVEEPPVEQNPPGMIEPPLNNEELKP